MKAFVYTEYGPPEVLKLREVEKPSPKEDEVLIRVHATAVTAGDCNARGFVFVPRGFGFLPRLMFGIRAPKRTILGVVVAGEIEAVGNEVTSFKAGDQVYGETGAGFGAYAEYVCLSEKNTLATKPANLSYEEAAAVPFGANYALYFLRDKAHIRDGQKILINGASGGGGTYAVQLARYYGAEVTGVCSTGNVELVRSLGAGKVIDYTQEDFTKNGETYDVIFDPVGRTTFSGCRDSLKRNGLYLAGAGGLKEFVEMGWTSLAGDKKVIAGSVAGRSEDLVFLNGLLETRRIRPVIDRIYPFEQLVEAHRYADQGHKKGTVVITVDSHA